MVIIEFVSRLSSVRTAKISHIYIQSSKFVVQIPCTTYLEADLTNSVLAGRHDSSSARVRSLVFLADVWYPQSSLLYREPRVTKSEGDIVVTEIHYVYKRTKTKSVLNVPERNSVTSVTRFNFINWPGRYSLARLAPRQRGRGRSLHDAGYHLVFLAQRGILLFGRVHPRYRHCDDSRAQNKQNTRYTKQRKQKDQAERYLMIQLRKSTHWILSRELMWTTGCSMRSTLGSGTTQCRFHGAHERQAGQRPECDEHIF